MDCGKPKACATRGLAEKGLKNVRQVRGGDAARRIPDMDAAHVTIAGEKGAHSASASCGSEGVAEDVEQHLTNLVRVDIRFKSSRLHFQMHPDGEWV